MKKVVCVMLVIVFVVCVYCYGHNQRFSFRKYIENISAGFVDMPSLQDFSDVWSSQYYWLDGVRLLPYWVDCYVLSHPDPDDITVTEPLFMGRYPLGYERDGTITTRYEYEWLPLVDEFGDPIKLVINGEVKQGTFPVLVHAQIKYESYEGPDFAGILEQGANTKAFFQRLSNTFDLIGESMTCLVSNLDVFLPWKATVRGV